jgi:hypothetical protein
MVFGVSFWPWSWWLAPTLSIGLCIVAWSIAHALVWRANRTLKRCARAVLKVGVMPDSAAFVVGDQKNRLLVSGGQLHVVDVPNAYLVQRFTLKQPAALKLYEDATDRITLRILFPSGARSRRFVSSSIVSVTWLFNLMDSAGKGVEYFHD